MMPQPLPQALNRPTNILNLRSTYIHSHHGNTRTGRQQHLARRVLTFHQALRHDPWSTITGTKEELIIITHDQPSLTYLCVRLRVSEFLRMHNTAARPVRSREQSTIVQRMQPFCSHRQCLVISCTRKCTTSFAYGVLESRTDGRAHGRVDGTVTFHSYFSYGSEVDTGRVELTASSIWLLPRVREYGRRAVQLLAACMHTGPSPR